MEIKSLKNIQTAFSYIRKVVIVSIISSAAISITSAILAYWFAERQREKIYVLDQGKSLMLALSQDLQNNRPAEAKEHIRRFHELFFTLTPEKSQIESNIERALLLADKSAYNYYRDISEKGYYNRLISANITQTLHVDSILLNTSIYPYEATTYATQKIIRQSIINTRQLETHLKLHNTSRSDDNPGGFMIENFRVVKNIDKETIER